VNIEFRSLRKCQSEKTVPTDLRSVGSNPQSLSVCNKIGLEQDKSAFHDQVKKNADLPNDVWLKDISTTSICLTDGLPNIFMRGSCPVALGRGKHT